MLELFMFPKSSPPYITSAVIVAFAKVSTSFNPTNHRDAAHKFDASPQLLQTESALTSYVRGDVMAGAIQTTVLAFGGSTTSAAAYTEVSTRINNVLARLSDDGTAAFGRRSGAGASLPSVIFFHGGIRGSGYTDFLSSFAVTGALVRDERTIATVNSNHAGVGMGDVALYFGGVNDTATNNNRLRCTTISPTATLLATTDIPVTNSEGKEQHAGAYAGGLALFYGGYDNFSVANTILLRLNKDRTIVSSNNTGGLVRRNHCGGNVGDLAVFVGAASGTTALRSAAVINSSGTLLNTESVIASQNLVSGGCGSV